MKMLLLFRGVWDHGPNTGASFFSEPSRGFWGEEVKPCFHMHGTWTIQRIC